MRKLEAQWDRTIQLHIWQ